jgi:hypothetical protein
MKLFATIICGFLTAAILASTASAANPVLTGTTQKRIISHKGGGTKNPSYKTPTEWVFPHGNGKGEAMPAPYQRPVSNKSIGKLLPTDRGRDLSMFRK